jgi:hypothetical protein
MADEREAWREAFCVLAKGESLLLFIILHTDFSILQYIITTCLVHLLGYEVRQFLDFIAQQSEARALKSVAPQILTFQSWTGWCVKYEVRQFLDFIATTVCWSWCLVTRIPGYSVWQQKTRV